MYVQVLQEGETYSGLDGAFVSIVPDDVFEEEMEQHLNDEIVGYWHDRDDGTMFVTEAHEDIFIMFHNTHIKVSLADILAMAKGRC